MLGLYSACIETLRKMQNLSKLTPGAVCGTPKNYFKTSLKICKEHYRNIYKEPPRMTVKNRF